MRFELRNFIEFDDASQSDAKYFS